MEVLQSFAIILAGWITGKDTWRRPERRWHHGPATPAGEYDRRGYE